MTYILLDIIKQSVKNQASDIHLTVGYPPQLRIDGSLVLAGGAPLTPTDLTNFADVITTPEIKEKFKNIKEIDFSYQLELDNELYRYRVITLQVGGNPSIAMRQISSDIKTIEQLNLPLLMKDFTKLNQGLVLLVGRQAVENLQH